MRHVDDLQIWVAERRALTGLIAELAEAPPSRRARVRTPDEHAMLERAALDSIALRAAEGRLVRLGPRRYELRPRPRV